MVIVGNGVGRYELVGVGVGVGGIIFTKTLAAAVPPGPEQFRVQVLLDDKGPATITPDVPDQPEGDTVQEVVLIEPQEMLN